MKWIFCLIMPVLFAGCNQPLKSKNSKFYSSPEEYNNYIIDRQKEVGMIVSSFYEVLTTKTDSARHILDHGLKIITGSLEEIKNMPDYHGDTTFRFAAVQSFNFYKRLFEDDYERILAFHSKEGDLAEVDATEQEKIVNKIMRDEEKCDKDLHNSQKDFAEKYHMRLSN